MICLHVKICLTACQHVALSTVLQVTPTIMLLGEFDWQPYTSSMSGDGGVATSRCTDMVRYATHTNHAPERTIISFQVASNASPCPAHRHCPALLVLPPIQPVIDMTYPCLTNGTGQVDRAFKYGSSRLNIVPTHYYRESRESGEIQVRTLMGIIRCLASAKNTESYSNSLPQGFCFRDSSYSACKAFDQAGISGVSWEGRTDGEGFGSGPPQNQQPTRCIAKDDSFLLDPYVTDESILCDLSRRGSGPSRKGSHIACPMLLLLGSSPSASSHILTGEFSERQQDAAIINKGSGLL